MSIKYWWRTLLLCLPLLLGAFAGAPMRPEEIEDLMHSVNQQVNQQKIVVTVDEDSDHESKKLPKLPELDP